MAYANPILIKWTIDNVIGPYQKHLEETKREKTKKKISPKSHKARTK